MISFAATLSDVHRQKRAERQSGAKAVVPVGVGPLIIQIQRKQARIGSIVPGAAAQSFQTIPSYDCTVKTAFWQVPYHFLRQGRKRSPLPPRCQASIDRKKQDGRAERKPLLLLMSARWLFRKSANRPATEVLFQAPPRRVFRPFPAFYCSVRAAF